MHPPLVQGGAPPPTHFDAGGYNNSFYAWKSGGDASFGLSGGRNRAYCNDFLLGGGNSNDDPTCRPHDPSYNEWHDLDSSVHNWNYSTPVDPNGVDDWVNNIGGGVYKAKPSALLGLLNFGKMRL